MKKLIALLLVLSTFVLSGCVSNPPENPSGESPDKPNENDVQVLVDNENVKVTFIEIFEMPELVGTCYLRLKVENKSDKTVRVSIKDSYVNDTAQMMGSGVPMILAPGKNSQAPFFFGYGNLGITSKDEIQKIELKVWLMDDDNFDTVEETDSLVIDLSK